MGWKNVKNYYCIGHIVYVRNGIIHIGTPYVHNLIMITFDGDVTWGEAYGASNNKYLARYYREMTADVAKLRELIQTPDTFAASKTVYTWDGGDIIEKQCEQMGWPHCTHDGLLMYDNEFSADKKKVIAWAVKDAGLIEESHARRVEELSCDLDTAKSRLCEARANVAALNRLRAVEGKT